LANTVSHFWRTRDVQLERQLQTARRDQGARGSVTVGKQMDGFVGLVRGVLQAAGISATAIHTEKSLELPGYFRPEKKWDLVVVDRGNLVAVVEFKSQVGPSFGNNFNNRAEEAIGSSQDIWTAYRDGALAQSARPWLGYVMLLEDCPKSTASVGVKQPHFAVFPEFKGASYSQRYQLLLTKLVRERLYDAACFLLSPRKGGQRGEFKVPNANLGFQQLVASLTGRVAAHLAS
jgi:hypothetical protein